MVNALLVLHGLVLLGLSWAIKLCSMKGSMIGTRDQMLSKIVVTANHIRTQYRYSLVKHCMASISTVYVLTLNCTSPTRYNYHSSTLYVTHMMSSPRPSHFSNEMLNS